MALKKVVYLSSEDYNTLITDGSVTVNGTTITYSADDIYLTPDNSAEKFAELQAAVEELQSKEYYQHHIYWKDTTNNVQLHFTIITTDSVKYSSASDIVGLFMYGALNYYDLIDFPVWGICPTADGTGTEPAVAFGVEGSWTAYGVVGASGFNSGFNYNFSGVTVLDFVSPLNLAKV